MRNELDRERQVHCLPELIGQLPNWLAWLAYYYLIIRHPVRKKERLLVKRKNASRCCQTFLLVWNIRLWQLLLLHIRFDNCKSGFKTFNLQLGSRYWDRPTRKKILYIIRVNKRATGFEPDCLLTSNTHLMKTSTLDGWEYFIDKLDSRASCLRRNSQLKMERSYLPGEKATPLHTTFDAFSYDDQIREIRSSKPEAKRKILHPIESTNPMAYPNQLSWMLLLHKRRRRQNKQDLNIDWQKEDVERVLEYIKDLE